MPNYRIIYTIQGRGEFYTEAADFNSAYKKMYDTFHEDNSLIVHAEYAYGYEITGAAESHKAALPKRPRYKVTTAEQKAKADAGEMIEPPAEKPVRFADTGLFVFD